MGFGILILGYILTLFDAFGAGIIGWPLVAVALWKLSSTYGKFRFASVGAMLCTFYPAMSVCVILKIFSDSTELYFALTVIYYIAVAFTCAVTFWGIRVLAVDGGSEKLSNQAFSHLYITTVYYIFVLAASLVPSISVGTFSMVLTASHYIIGVYNIWFFYTCFAKMTTATQLEKDRRFFKKLEEKEAAKKSKRS